MLPTATFTTNEVAALTGRSRKAVVKLIDNGLLSATGNIHRRVSAAEVEKLLGRRLTPPMLMAAATVVAPQRAAQGQRNARRHLPEPGYVGA